MHFGKLVPVNAHWFCQHNDKLVQRGHILKYIVTLKSDTGNTCIYSVCGRLVCILGTVSMRRRGNPLPASPARAIYRQHMKYGSYLIEGKMSRDFIFCVCDTCDSWARERQIAYGIMVEWETITKVICSCYLHSSTRSLGLTVSVTVTSVTFFFDCHPPGLVSRFTFQDKRK